MIVSQPVLACQLRGFNDRSPSIPRVGERQLPIRGQAHAFDAAHTRPLRHIYIQARAFEVLLLSRPADPLTLPTRHGRRRWKSRVASSPVAPLVSCAAHALPSTPRTARRLLTGTGSNKSFVPPSPISKHGSQNRMLCPRARGSLPNYRPQWRLAPDSSVGRERTSPCSKIL